MTDYSKMTKAELIEALKRSDDREIAITTSRNYYRDSRNDIRAEYDALLNSRPNMPSGWWLGVALFAAILIPWVFFAMWVMG